jgi:hypothetical protein
MVKDDINVFSDSEIGDMLESPLAVLEKAYELAPDDTTVLNRYGRSLWNNCERMKSNAKIHALKKQKIYSQNQSKRIVKGTGLHMQLHKS